MLKPEYLDQKHQTTPNNTHLQDKMFSTGFGRLLSRGKEKKYYKTHFEAMI